MRSGIIIAEIVDHFLGPDGCFRRQLAVIEKPADVGIAAGIDVDGKGGHRFIRNPLDAGDILAVIAFAVLRLGSGIRIGIRGGATFLCDGAAGSGHR